MPVLTLRGQILATRSIFEAARKQLAHLTAQAELIIGEVSW